jgi:hypothetical protein
LFVGPLGTCTMFFILYISDSQKPKNARYYMLDPAQLLRQAIGITLDLYFVLCNKPPNLAKAPYSSADYSLQLKKCQPIKCFTTVNFLYNCFGFFWTQVIMLYYCGRENQTATNIFEMSTLGSLWFLITLVSWFFSGFWF